MLLVFSSGALQDLTLETFRFSGNVLVFLPHGQTILIEGSDRQRFRTNRAKDLVSFVTFQTYGFLGDVSVCPPF